MQKAYARNLTKNSFDLVSAPAFLPFVVEVPDNSNRFWELADMCNFDRNGSTRLGEINAHCYELVTEWYKTTKDTRADTLVRIANFGRCKWLEMSAKSPIRLEGLLAQAQADPLPNTPTFYINCQTFRVITPIKSEKTQQKKSQIQCLKF